MRRPVNKVRASKSLRLPKRKIGIGVTMLTRNSTNSGTLEILRRQLYLLDLVRLYYNSEKSLDELAPDISASEMQDYLDEHDYPPRPKSLTILKQIDKKIENERQDVLVAPEGIRRSGGNQQHSHRKTPHYENQADILCRSIWFRLP